MRKFPSLLYFESTELYEADPVQYRGDLDVNGLLEFVKEKVQRTKSTHWNDLT